MQNYEADEVRLVIEAPPAKLRLLRTFLFSLSPSLLIKATNICKGHLVTLQSA